MVIETLDWFYYEETRVLLKFLVAFKVHLYGWPKRKRLKASWNVLLVERKYMVKVKNNLFLGLKEATDFEAIKNPVTIPYIGVGCVLTFQKGAHSALGSANLPLAGPLNGVLFRFLERACECSFRGEIEGDDVQVFVFRNGPVTDH